MVLLVQVVTCAWLPAWWWLEAWLRAADVLVPPGWGHGRAWGCRVWASGLCVQEGTGVTFTCGRAARECGWGTRLAAFCLALGSSVAVHLCWCVCVHTRVCVFVLFGWFQDLADDGRYVAMW